MTKPLLTGEEIALVTRADRAAVGRIMRSADGERLLRFIVGLTNCRREGLQADPRADAYQKAGIDLVARLERLRDEIPEGL